MESLQGIFYDCCPHGAVRLTKNTLILKQDIERLSIPFHIVPVQRSRPFPGDIDMESILEQDSPDYAAMIINSHGKDSRGILETAMLFVPAQGLPTSRIIYLAESKIDLNSGVTVIPGLCGNGYLDDRIARDVSMALSKIAKEHYSNPRP